MKISIILENNLLRFLIVGGLNTLFGFTVYAIFAMTEMATSTVLIISNLIGMLFNFFTTGGIVFFDTRISTLPRFLFCYIAIYFIYLELINWLEPILNSRILAMALIILPMTILSYLMLKFFVYRRKLEKSNLNIDNK